MSDLRPDALFGIHLGGALSEGVGVARLGLNADLGRLHGGQGDVGEELSAG